MSRVLPHEMMARCACSNSLTLLVGLLHTHLLSGQSGCYKRLFTEILKIDTLAKPPEHLLRNKQHCLKQKRLHHDSVQLTLAEAAGVSESVAGHLRAAAGFEAPLMSSMHGLRHSMSHG